MAAKQGRELPGISEVIPEVPVRSSPSCPAESPSSLVSPDASNARSGLAEADYVSSGCGSPTIVGKPWHNAGQTKGECTNPLSPPVIGHQNSKPLSPPVVALPSRSPMPNGGPTGPSILICCAGPSVERARHLQHSLEKLGVTVSLKTDADIVAGDIGIGEPRRTNSGRLASSVSLLEGRGLVGSASVGSMRSFEPGITPPEGASSPAPSLDRAQGSSSPPPTSEILRRDLSGSQRGDLPRTANPCEDSEPEAPSQQLVLPIAKVTRSRRPSHARAHSGDIGAEGWGAVEEAAGCDAVLVLWSQFFPAKQLGKLSELTDRAGGKGTLLLNDVQHIVHMQDRRWLLKKLKDSNLATPHFAECSRDNSLDPALEEHNDFIIVGNVRVNKPFVEKPVDRRDREIYVYFPKSTGGGRVLLSTRESGDIERVCHFDPHSRIRREGSFIYQEYVQSDGFVVQAVYCGGQAFGMALSQNVMMTGCTPPASPYGTTPTGECPVILRQEEKLIAKKLSVLMHQTLFGMTFLRAQSDLGKVKSHVVDVWPGIPRAGFSAFVDDVSRSLLAAVMRRLPSPGNLHRSRSAPRIKRPEGSMEQDSSPCFAKSIWEASQQLSSSSSSQQEPWWQEDVLCVLVLCRHGARTPKQKAKAKVKLASEFAAGYLSGWLVGHAANAMEASEPKTSHNLRSRDQLSRLNQVAEQWRLAGHRLGTFADAMGKFDKLGEACHAKMGTDGVTMNVAIKWGGELTSVGIERAHALGAAFRTEALADIELGSLRHDTKIYSSSEPRCQQTAAAFCRGFLRLAQQALPPIIAALVRKDGWGTLEAGREEPVVAEKKEKKEKKQDKSEKQKKQDKSEKQEKHDQNEKHEKNEKPHRDEQDDGHQTHEKHSKNTEEGLQEHSPVSMETPLFCPPSKEHRKHTEEVLKEHGPVSRFHSSKELENLEVSWSDLESLAGPSSIREAFRATVQVPALSGFDAPGPALRELRARAERLQEALTGTPSAPLYNAETMGLARDRYKDTLDELQLGESPRSFAKLEKLLDHLQYDNDYNRDALPPAAQDALAESRPLCEALCNAQTVLEVAQQADPDCTNRDITGVSFLRKLRWDLRVASGADFGEGEEKTHLEKHSHLYADVGGQTCMRTRLYFSHNSHLQGLLTALSRARPGKQREAKSAAAVRLDFLAHVVMQLHRRRVGGALRVTCHFRRSDNGEKVYIFDLPFEEVDEWFTELLVDIPDPTLSLAAADRTESVG